MNRVEFRVTRPIGFTPRHTLAYKLSHTLAYKLSHTLASALICLPALSLAQSKAPIYEGIPAAQTGRVLGFTTGTLAAPVRPLSLLEAWRLAVDNDPTLRAAWAAAAAGRERLPQANAQLQPNFAFSASRFNNDVNRDALDTLSQPFSTRSRYVSRNETLVLRQPLFRQQQWVGVRQAGYQIEDSEAEELARLIEEKYGISMGLGAIVDADIGKSAAAVQALQVRQQLGIQSLSIANQQPSVLLGLFR
jgi:hypothetical protein